MNISQLLIYIFLSEYHTEWMYILENYVRPLQEHLR